MVAVSAFRMKLALSYPELKGHALRTGPSSVTLAHAVAEPRLDSKRNKKSLFAAGIAPYDVGSCRVRQLWRHRHTAGLAAPRQTPFRVKAVSLGSFLRLADSRSTHDAPKQAKGSSGQALRFNKIVERMTC